jgi:hypothetical protein
MMRHLLLIPLAAFLLAGCGGFVKGTGPAATDCNPQGFRIRVSSYNGLVHGFSGIDCYTKPQSYQAVVTLEYRQAGQPWSPVGNSFTSVQIPSPSKDYHVIATCVPGVYRVRVTVTGVSSTGEAGGGSAHSQPFRIDDCTKNFDSGVVE